MCQRYRARSDRKEHLSYTILYKNYVYIGHSISNGEERENQSDSESEKVVVVVS